MPEWSRKEQWPGKDSCKVYLIVWTVIDAQTANIYQVPAEQNHLEETTTLQAFSSEFTSLVVGTQQITCQVTCSKSKSTKDTKGSPTSGELSSVQLQFS